MEPISHTIKPVGVAPYALAIGYPVWDRLNALLPATSSGAVLISDARVDRLYGNSVARLLGDSLLQKIVFPEGESAKTREQKAKLEDSLIEAGLDRHGVAVILGGGVAGDLAGFVAATYFRGIPTILLPTTVLAMVDSAIGGKTGINTPHGKNLIGTFHHPLGVLANTACLETLPREEWRNGLAEMAKAGVIDDAGLFHELADHGFTPETPLDAVNTRVARAAAVKIRVIEKDPQEKGLRKVLNFGHTIGHAIEAVSGYALRHGYCVAWGMHLEIDLAVQAGLLPEEEGRVIKAGLDRMGLPLDLPAGLECAALLEAMTRDKKNRSGRIHFSLPEELGRMAPGPDQGYSLALDEDAVRKVLEEAGL